MTPEAVIDRYLALVVQDPVDTDQLGRLLGSDADLLAHWLRLLDCPAEPGAIAAALDQLSHDEFRELAIAQALAVLATGGSVHLGFEQWRSVLASSFLAEAIAGSLELPDAVALRWRVLLAASGVNLPGDPLLMELLAFRGVRRELLEDASPIHRLYALIEIHERRDALASQDAARELLDLDATLFQTLLADAEARCSAHLAGLGLDQDRDSAVTERLWLRVQISVLERLFDQLPDAGLAATLPSLNAALCRRLFGHPALLFRIDRAAGKLVGLGEGVPVIALASQSSSIARSARLGERGEFADRPEQAVVDRQVLRALGGTDAVALPLRGSAGRVFGVAVFVLDEDQDQEAAMALYADALGRSLSRREQHASPEARLLERYRQREEKRLRELVHEANNPLSVIRNYLHILESRLQHETTVVEQLRLIGDELARAGGILGQAPRLSEVEPLQSPVNVAFSELDLNELVRGAAELHLGYAADHRVTLSTRRVAGTLPVTSDPNRLAQILNNLLRNAIEAAAGTSVTVSVRGGVYREGREGALLGIADLGPGLPPEVLQQLFEPKQSLKGGDHAGLGLHIVHRLVAEIGGSIDVQTTPGTGTEFTIFVPRSPK